MKKKKLDPLNIALYGMIIFAVLYVSAALGAAMDLSVGEDGVLDFTALMANVEAVLTSPETVWAHFTDFSGYGAKITLLVAFALGIYALMKYTSKKRLHRKGVEHGSARWANAKEEQFLRDNEDKKKHKHDWIGKLPRLLKFLEKPLRIVLRAPAFKEIPYETDNNIILTQEVRMSLNTRQHRENLNVLVIGGSGAGKSRFYVKPNLMQLNTSYVVTDPKGELLRSCGKLLKKAGYEIRVFNLIDMAHSNNYNPFNYVYDKSGEMNKTYVMKMVNCLMKNTKQEGASGGEQFWDDSTKALTLAIAFYLLEKKDAKDGNGNSLDRNFSTVMRLMRLAEISEQDENHRSELDDMMDELREENPMSMAVSYYADFKKAPAETAKSILISAAVRFAAFNLPEVADLTHTDNIHLDTLGDKKTALFVIIPSSDATFNFLAAMMYTQLFDTLYDTANFKYGGRLPVHVRCLLDEFANIGTIPDFDKLLATMRSMEISANIIIQNLAQLKKMYDKSWEIVTGNCDSLLFLGGKEDSTLEAISKSLGKETIDVVSQNRTRSHKSPSTSENNSILGRELMTPDELKVMKTNECVLMVRALYPFFCHKFDIEKHVNYAYLEDSNQKYAYLIDDLHTEKAPDPKINHSEKIPPKGVSKPIDDEKSITDVDIPEDETEVYEMAGDNLDNEFVGDENEIAAALARNEQNAVVLSSDKYYNSDDKLDFADVELPAPENIAPLDMTERKIFGESDYNAMFDSAAIF